MVTGLRLDCLPIAGNVEQRSASSLCSHSLSALLPACLPASGLAAKMPTLISFQALGWALCELPLLTPDKVNEERNWPPAETKGKAKSVCEGNTPLFSNHSSAGSCRFGLF